MPFEPHALHMPPDRQTRRAWLIASGAWALPRLAQAAFGPQLGEPLRFPADFGAHPALRTEWWYLTGELRTGDTAARTFGFQITFFRSRVDAAATATGRFAAHQLVFAHAALTDLGPGAAGRQGGLLHDQRIARAGFGLAQAAEGDTDVVLRDWVLRRHGPVTASIYDSRIAARAFELDLRFTQTQPLLPQGEAGYSRKGPRPGLATHYYSQPQLAAQGRVRHEGRWQPVQGRAWLDHEWGETLLDRDAVGWDWIGINLRDGGALMAFQIRRRDGSALWRGGTWRRPGEAPRAFAPEALRFTPGRVWTSPATGARYPVEWVLSLPGRRWTVRARVDDQELDSRQSTGNVYWEGPSALLDEAGRQIGQGYLEMTGYAAPMAL